MWRIKRSIQLVTIRLNKITNLDIVIVLLGSISDIFFKGQFLIVMTRTVSNTTSCMSRMERGDGVIYYSESFASNTTRGSIYYYFFVKDLEQ